MDSKSDIRAKAKILRQKLDIQSKSINIIQQIRQSKEYQAAKNIMVFYPLKYEINLLELLKDDKNFYFPKVNGQDMLVCPYTDKFEKSKLNIFEPCSNPQNPEILDLIFVPALAVDLKNYRLGYGKGFYDRFLTKYPNIKTIAAIAKELIFDELPHDKFDVRIDKIIKA